MYEDDVPVGPNLPTSKGIESLKGRLYEDKENILLRLETLYLIPHSRLLLRVRTPYPTKLRREEVDAYLTFTKFLVEDTKTYDDRILLNEIALNELGYRKTLRNRKKL